MSCALTRLREYFIDELPTQVGKTMEFTRKITLDALDFVTSGFLGLVIPVRCDADAVQPPLESGPFL
jgi:hypothetical protein